MKLKKNDPMDLELMKGDFIVSIIRAQEEADRALRKCEELESLEYSDAEACRCREVAKNLQRKADCYMRKYQTLKKRKRAGDQ